MKHAARLIIVPLLALGLSGISATGARCAETWKAGAASAKITPTGPLWMSGFGNRTKPAQATSQDLWAKALALEDSHGNRAVLVTLDLVGIDRATSLAVGTSLQAKYGLRRDQICLNCSHTHCGPIVGRNLQAMFFLDKEQWRHVDEYNLALQEKIVAVVGEALSKCLPATISFGNGTVDFAINRRNNPRDGAPLAELRKQGLLRGPSDHDVPVLKVVDAQGRLSAIVSLYACHATILAFDQWSGDWPGYAQEHLQRAHPGTIAMFCAGCGGDQAPWPREPETVERADDYGKRFAQAVERVLAGAMTTIDGSLATDYREIELPLASLPSRSELETQTKSRNRFAARRATLALEQLDSEGALRAAYPYPVQVWKVGSALRFVALGGEAVVDYALRFKQEFGRESTWVAGYSNDVMAYIPSRRVLAEGGYEGGNSMIYYGLPTVWAPEIEEMILQAVGQQLKRTDAATKPKPSDSK